LRRAGELGFALLASACTSETGQEPVRAILALGFFGFSIYAGTLITGAIHVRQNRKSPTRASRRWGFVLGVLNVLHGLAGSAFFVTLLRDPGEPPPPTDVYLMVAAAALGALGMGIACLVTAARAVVPAR
jgi:Na+/proline symporter